MNHPKSETLSGAEIVVRLLERQGVRQVAGIPGGAILPFYDALSQSTRIDHILARHEQGGGFMAQGMSRVTGQPAVCIATGRRRRADGSSGRYAHRQHGPAGRLRCPEAEPGFVHAHNKREEDHAQARHHAQHRPESAGGQFG